MSAHLRYLGYVVRHKWFVFVAGLKTGAPLWRLVIHDWSKFLPSEWSAYVRFFYGESEEDFVTRMMVAEISRLLMDTNIDKARQVANEAWEKVSSVRQAAFDVAWLKHQHRSPHHWQHWVLREDSGATKILPMPIHFVREMVADWMGAGRAITGKWETAAWYAQNRDRIVLHPDSRALVETLLPIQAPEVKK